MYYLADSLIYCSYKKPELNLAIIQSQFAIHSTINNSMVISVSLHPPIWQFLVFLITIPNP